MLVLERLVFKARSTLAPPQLFVEQLLPTGEGAPLSAQ
jgi:hypothetical protein